MIVVFLLLIIHIFIYIKFSSSFGSDEVVQGTLGLSSALNDLLNPHVELRQL